MRKKALKEQLTGYLFVGPMLVGLTILTVIPIVASLYLSLTEWSLVQGLSGIHFTGLSNFIRLFKDPIFIHSLGNNLIFMLVVPISLAAALLLAVVINKYVYAKSVFKVVYFMPYISSVVAVAVVCQVLFHPEYGPVNAFLKSLGMANPPKWLGDPDYALMMVMAISIWAAVDDLSIIEAGNRRVQFSYRVDS
ncbi:sugar ABC transporter permease [Paenibacillus athensensis]|uniref:Sugar ABC transporter permease n=1 Tax=Paenibacillus athensensis TaxID=1967502 RepID=A0A4Y8PXL5_9BACL|nr:sugar ABC transporter permease [Paenibacillus athensensis]MCD1259897.1 sugar ABC transporter permease [Paenibacillus athensensis]